MNSKLCSVSTLSFSITEALFETLAYLLSEPAVKNKPPAVGLVLGSGLGSYADTFSNLHKIPYATIPHMQASKVAGHLGQLCFGDVGQVRVVCMQGRIHPYEGYPLWQVVHGVRVMAKLGVKAIFLTNAAGGLDSHWQPGDLMNITDHLNLTGQNVLVGPNEKELGPRFPDMSQAYDPELNLLLKKVAAKANIPLREGVYAGLSGPTYETPAEIRMLRLLGASAVGMSTVHEVMALRHMDVKVCALSCITNLAAGILPQKLAHSEVEKIAAAKQKDVMTLLTNWIENMNE